MRLSFHDKAPLSLAAFTGALLALAALVLAAGAGFGSRWAWWHFGTGFGVLRWSVYVAMAAAVISLLGVIMSRPGSGRRGLMMALLGLLLSVPVIIVPWSWKDTAQSVPPIHDISTDVVNVPQFVAILPLRAGAPNSAQYGGPAIAAQQRSAYPDIQPVVVSGAPAMVFDAALQSARALGWNIVAKDPGQGRIEATDTTFWFGFTDDVVIRITPQGSGARLDVRSVSRVGRSDVGTNAARIRAFVKQFKQAIKQDA